MAKFLIQANYSFEGAKGLMKEGGSARRAAVEKAAASVGGKVEAFYFTFGPSDACLIVDVPDNISAVALSLAATQSGLAEVSTVPLITPEEMDAATKKAVKYRGPGK